MPIGKGKYDDLCTAAREGAGAQGALLVIIKGEQGSGFSVQVPPAIALGLPALLRSVADDIEKSLKEGKI